MGPPAAAALPDELMEEILVRIPPSDPATLARAAVAWKRWCRLLASPGFRRRYRDRHRVPPMLGFFCNPRDSNGISTSFVPASSFRSEPRSAVHRNIYPEDARHGRVLLITGRGRVDDRRDGGIIFEARIPEFGLVVWDPITGHQVALPRPKGFCDKWNWKATVLCAAPAGSCGHLDCHRGHFIVVLIGDYPGHSPNILHKGMFSCVYSSQAGAWSPITFTRHLGGTCRLGGHAEKRSAHLGNALYCMCTWEHWYHKILKYDLGTREFSVMEPPPLLLHEEFRWEDEHHGVTPSEHIELATMEDGQLGLVVLQQSTLYILSTNEEFGWGGTKIIDLKNCDNYVPSTIPPFLIGFAGDVGLVFMNTENNGILSADINSAQVKVVDKRPSITRIVPYINFCSPVMGVRKIKNGAGVSASSVGQSCVAGRLPSQAMGVPSKDDKPREGASRDVQSCVVSSLLRQAMGVPSKDDRPRAGASSDRRSSVAISLLSQANGTGVGGRSQQPVGGRHRARAVRPLQPRLYLATCPKRFSSPSPQGK